MKIRLEITGGQELARRLRALPDRVSRSVQLDALRAGAEPIRATAGAIAPRAPGAPDLADNIVISTARAEDEGAVAVAVGPARFVFWGLFQEFGTRFHGAQAFLRPAFDEKAQASLSIISGVLWRSLRSETGGPNTGGRFL